MERLFIFNTDSNEFELFIHFISKCVSHGPNNTDDIYDIQSGMIRYFSIEKFINNSAFKHNRIGVAGNKIVSTETFSVTVDLWLKEWNINYSSELKIFNSQEDSQLFFFDLRKITGIERINNCTILKIQNKINNIKNDKPVIITATPKYLENYIIDIFKGMF